MIQTSIAELSSLIQFWTAFRRTIHRGITRSSIGASPYLVAPATVRPRRYLIGVVTPGYPVYGTGRIRRLRR